MDCDDNFYSQFEATLLETGRLQTKFKEITDLGEGSFGKVFKATSLVDKKLYAIK